ncbi:MAG: efflux RND transporter permease subunit [Bacteroidales bacterium]|nr:efflux RND transporter permease subunit [Bacteroidales bacterium]
MFTYQEVDKKKTYSYTQNNIVYVFVELNDNIYRKDEAWSKIRHGLKDFKMTLPAGVLALLVNDDFGNTSSLLITMDSEDKTNRELQEQMSNLCDALRTIPEVGNIKVYGTIKEEINVYVEQEKIVSYGINQQVLMANLYLQGLLSPGGSVDDYPIHISSQYSSEREIGEQIVYSDPTGNIVKLKDIARIERQYAKPTSYISKDDKNTIVLSVEMRSGNNIVKFGNEVDVVLAEFEETLPESVTIYRITDLPKFVGKSVFSFLRDLVLSIIIVIGVMLLLFPLKSAFVAAIGIPISTAISIGIMYLVGMELNTVTLAALIVVLGMIVDNSIVVIDGYTELLKGGHSRWYSAIESANNYASSLIVATLAICIMFYPMLFTFTGVFSDFVKLFPFTISISLLTSLGIALFVVPHMEFRYIKLPKKDAKISFLTKAQNKLFDVLEGGFDKLLDKCFKYPAFVLLFASGIVVAAVLLFMATPIQMMPLSDRDCFTIEIHLPYGSSLQETAKVCDSIENMFGDDDRIIAMTKFVGTSSPRFAATYAPNMPGSNYAQFIVNTKSEKATESFISEYHDKMYNYFPEAVVRIKQLDYQAMKNPIEIRFYGDNIDTLKGQTDKLVAFLRTMEDETPWPHTDCDGYVPAIKVDINSEEAFQIGITKTGLATNLAMNLNGIPLTTVWEGDYSIPVKLMIEREDGGVTSTTLKDEMISSGVPGVSVPLRQVADLSAEWYPAQITHRNGVNCITVSSDMKYGGSQPLIMKKVNKYIKEEITPNLPEGVSIEYGGLSEANKTTAPEVLITVIFAVLVMFFFIVFNFKKISLALLTVFSTALCLFGALLGLRIFNMDLSLTAVLGVVSLIGIIVRNGIIMFEYAEQLHNEEHYSYKEAALLAGKRRMRPIFLTSTTTAVGVVPMIISQSALWMPLGVIIFFGTTFSILLIVTVLPVSYWKMFEVIEKRKLKKNAR